VWGVLAVAAFGAANPYLWPDPLGRIIGQVTYFRTYADGQRDNYDVWKPITQLITPQEHWRHLLPAAQTALFTLTDPLIFGMACVGVWLLLWRAERRAYGVWLVVGMAFLMWWTTQWIQHKMVIVVPLALAAAVPLESAAAWAWRRWRGTPNANAATER
jgi:hypothetical protein